MSTRPSIVRIFSQLSRARREARPTRPSSGSVSQKLSQPTSDAPEVQVSDTQYVPSGGEPRVEGQTASTTKQKDTSGSVAGSDRTPASGDILEEGICNLMQRWHSHQTSQERETVIQMANIYLAQGHSIRSFELICQLFGIRNNGTTGNVELTLWRHKLGQALAGKEGGGRQYATFLHESEVLLRDRGVSADEMQQGAKLWISRWQHLSEEHSRSTRSAAYWQARSLMDQEAASTSWAEDLVGCGG